MIAALATPASSAAAVPPGFGESTVATGLSQPTAIAFLPDGGMLATEKAGALKLVRGGAVTTLANLPVCTDKSMGLLGVAVDPAFASNGLVYLYRTRPAGNEGSSCPTVAGRVNEVVRLRLENDRLADGPAAILTGIRTDNGQHNGGALRIGTDGRLYVSTGDTGVGDFLPGGGITPPGGSTNPFAQDLAELPGKVLRIALDGTVPPDNPFIGVPGARPEVFAYGFRNPFRFGIDPVTGLLWLGDVGQNTWEELNVVRAAGNYGWPVCEATEPVGCDPPGHVAPVFQYRHDTPTSLGSSITGGAFAPCGFGAYARQYFFGDYSSDRLFRAVPNSARDGLAEAPAVFSDGAAGPVDIVFGPEGALHYVAIEAGEVRRITAPATACASQPQAPQSAGRPPAPASGAAGDRKRPRVRLRFRPRQRVGPLQLTVRLDEVATVTVSGKVPARGRRTPYRFRRFERRLEAGRWLPVRLHPARAAVAALRRAVSKQRLVARVKVAAVDRAGNETRRAVQIRLRQ